jgi:hypothetical protein
MDGELITTWTIRGSLLAYAVVVLALSSPHWRAHRTVLRWIWTAGFLMLVVHIACAFHFYHGWSHSQAVEQTAAETQSLLGWSFGGGVYFNYAMVLVWLVDVASWWIAPATYERRHWAISAVIHGYIFFIAFNGAVVFEDGPTRWFGIGMALLLAVLLVRRSLELRKTAGQT